MSEQEAADMKAVSNPARLAIVVPCYNEEPALPETLSQLKLLLSNMKKDGLIAEESGIYLVDDGSKDQTWNLIVDHANLCPHVHGIKLSRNRGHQNALIAGLEFSEGDAVVTLDADLQDDITVVRQMVGEYYRGAEIVYGVRKSRELDTLFKRFTAQIYYRALKKLGVDIISNHADFRLMSRCALDALQRYEETNLFLRGIIPSIGFPSAIVEYDRGKRIAGTSKYPLRKMLALAVDGITSFSSLPLRIIAALGLVIFLMSGAISLWILWARFFTDKAIPGWASSVLPIYFLSGIQLLSLGVLGEYVGKIYMETKRRPRYFVETTTRQGGTLRRHKDQAFSG